MHSLNHFLINLDSDDLAFIYQNGNIFATEHSQFGSYVERKFDDNNWYTALTVTYKDGTPTAFSSDNYRGGVDAWVEDRDSWNFDAAVDAAYKSLYWDVNNRINILTNEDRNNDREFQSIEDAAAAIREALADSYAGTDIGIDDWRLSYTRPWLAATYERFNDKYFTPPFFNAWDVNPYNARTFDLTDGEDFGLAILTVDVHT
jgi:hypothetical protein